MTFHHHQRSAYCVVVKKECGEAGDKSGLATVILAERIVSGNRPKWILLKKLMNLEFDIEDA